MEKSQCFQFQALGTHWQIDITNSPDIDTADFFVEIKNKINQFEKTYSRFLPDSTLRKIAEEPGDHLLTEEIGHIFDLYYNLYHITKGVFTPLIAQTLIDAGYDEKYSLQQKNTFQKTLSWEESIEYNFPNLKIKQKTLFDFGAAGKGYIIDIISEMCRKKGIANFCIDAGGDIFYQNKNLEKLKIGLENPQNFEEVIGVVEIVNKSICASSPSRRKWGDFSHMINPFSHKSPQTVLACWVVADSAMVADALATCLHLVDKKILLPYFHFDYVILYSDGKVEVSKNLEAEIFV